MTLQHLKFWTDERNWLDHQLTHTQNELANAQNAIDKFDREHPEVIKALAAKRRKGLAELHDQETPR